MRRSMLLAALAVAAIGTLGSANAAPLVRPEGLATGTGIVEQTQYRPYCGRWRAECARRWGFGGWRYRRCLTIRGCL